MIIDYADVADKFTISAHYKNFMLQGVSKELEAKILEHKYFKRKSDDALRMLQREKRYADLKFI
jgi:hypothetical protein